jgi:hypothetical protein
MQTYEAVEIQLHISFHAPVALLPRKKVPARIAQEAESALQLSEQKYFQWVSNLRLVSTNVVVEWLTLLLRIREISASNIGPVNDYPDWGFSWFCSVYPGDRQSFTLKLGHDLLLSYPFQFIIHVLPFHLTPYNQSCWQSVVK